MNIAGVSAWGTVDKLTHDHWKSMVDTNLMGPIHVIEAFLPPMVEARLAKQRMGGDVEALLKSRVKRIPLGFAGDGRDTANAVLFLASDEARFITGTEIVVDGGMTVRCD